jgi:hypothetical protein
MVFSCRRYSSRDSYTIVPESGGSLSSSGRGSSLIINRRNNEITSTGESKRMASRARLSDAVVTGYLFGLALLNRRSYLHLYLPDSISAPSSYDNAILAYGVFGIISLLQSE